MAVTVQLADDIVEDVNMAAKAHNRSVADQVTHWINIGRIAETINAFNVQKIEQAFKAELSPDELYPLEYAFYMEMLHNYMRNPPDEVVKTYKELGEQALADGYEPHPDELIDPDNTDY